MTSSQIARLFKARRIGKGKWMSKCPAHRERTGSMSITDMGDGRTRLHCFAGCSQRAILDAAGIRWADLKPNTKPDREAIRLAEKMRAEADGQRQSLKAKLDETIRLSQFWATQARGAGKLLLSPGNGSKIAALFHEALDRSRKLDESAVEQMCLIYGFRKDDFSWGEPK